MRCPRWVYDAGFWALEVAVIVVAVIANYSASLPGREFAWGIMAAASLAVVQLGVFTERPLEHRAAKVLEIGLGSASAYVCSTFLGIGVGLAVAALAIKATAFSAYQQLCLGRALRRKVANLMQEENALQGTDTRVTIYRPRMTVLGRRSVAMFRYCHTNPDKCASFGVRGVRVGRGVVGQCAKLRKPQLEILTPEEKANPYKYLRSTGRFPWWEAARLSEDREAYWSLPLMIGGILYGVFYVDTDTGAVLDNKETRQRFETMIESLLHIMEVAKEVADAH